MHISWFPGHMAKARRNLDKQLPRVNAVVEVIDARAPYSSRNPDLQQRIRNHKRLLVAAKADLASPDDTKQWLQHWRTEGLRAVAVDLRDTRTRQTLRRELQRMVPQRSHRALKVIIVGVPNVGKSTLINSLSGRTPTRTGAKPGVTRGEQWNHIARGIHVLDTPGLMPPKVEHDFVGLRLAWLGSIGENAYDAVEVARALLQHLSMRAPKQLHKRYKVDPSPSDDLLERIAEQRGMLRAGGISDVERAADVVLKEFRAGKIGRFTLERPSDVIHSS